MFQEWDIRNEEQIAECVRHSDIVYNLVGRDYETKYVYPFFFSLSLMLPQQLPTFTSSLFR